jgi:hypothetical protein
MKRLVLLLVCLALLGAACSDDGGDDDESFDDPSSSDSADSGSDDGASACLLGDDEVAELLGQAVGGVDESGGSDAPSTCTWSTEEPSAVVDGPITLTIERGELDDEVSADVQEAIDDPSSQVQDIGDAAVLVCGLGADGTDCDQYDSVLVVVGDTYLDVDLGNWGYPDDYDEDEGNQIMIDAATQAAEALG